MRCPACGELEDRVVDSRAAEEGDSIRRRRECSGCGHRFTTFERIEVPAPFVVKRGGDRVPFDRAKVVAGVAAAAKGRPVPPEAIEALAAEVEEEVRGEGPDVSSQRIGLAVLDRLRELDQVAYLRFVSVYKGFDDPADFERELGRLAGGARPSPHART